MFKQPRVPEYRENEGAAKHLKALTLFLKDFCQDVWTACRLTDKGLSGISYPVTSVNKKTGDVMLNASDVGARADSWMPTAEQVGARPADWTPTAEQVGARPADWTPSASDVGALPSNGTAVDSSKLGGKEPNYYMTDYGRGEVLWEGSWSGGAITVPNTSKYTGFQIFMTGISATILAMKHDGNIRGVGGHAASESSSLYTYHFSSTVSGDEWTLGSCRSVAHTPSGSHGGNNVQTVAKVVGLF